MIFFKESDVRKAYFLIFLNGHKSLSWGEINLCLIVTAFVGCIHGQAREICIRILRCPGVLFDALRIKILILTGKRSPEETVVFSRPPVSFHYSLEEGGKIETTVIESQVQRTGVSGRCVTDDA